VYLVKPGQPNPYQAQVTHGGKLVHLGSFVTAEEAALCVARSPEGQAAAERAASTAPLKKSAKGAAGLTSEEARQQAHAEGLTLRVAKSKTGYFGVKQQAARPSPYEARFKRDGKDVYLGSFATAEEAALFVARSPEGQAVAAERPAATPPLTSEEARQQAQAEGLTLRLAENKTGYSGVTINQSSKSKPYVAKAWRGSKDVHLGSFATAEEAALCLARSPEGQAAAEERAAALTSEEARQQARAEGLTLRVAESKTGYFGVHHKPGLSKPYQAQVSRGGKHVSLGYFATAEEAALCVARSQ